MSRTSKRSPRTRGPGIPGWVRVLGSLSGSALLWILTGATLVIGLPLIDASTQNLAQEPTRIQWIDLPAWQQSPGWSGILADVEKTINLDPLAKIYDKDVCPYVAQQALASPWIKQVKKVWKQLDGHVCVQAEFRVPTAVVQVGQEYHLIDDAAVRLPLPTNAVRPEEWIVIRGVRAKVPGPGQKWEGDDLAAGLKLLGYLTRAAANDRLPFRSELVAIDVSKAAHKSTTELRLITRSERLPLIIWGLPPGEEVPVEKSAANKLKELTEIYGPNASFPEFPWVDVRPTTGWLHPD